MAGSGIESKLSIFSILQFLKGKVSCVNGNKRCHIEFPL